MAAHPQLTSLLERVLAGDVLTLGELPEVGAVAVLADVEDENQPALFS